MFVVALAVLAFGSVPGAASAQEEINACGKLENSSTTYVLGQDLEGSETCINVESGTSNVIIDGKNHTVRYNGSDPGSDDWGIRLDSQNVTVRNVTVDGWYDGIYTQDAHDATLENIEVANSTNNGIWVQDTVDPILTDVHVSASDTGEPGIWLQDAENPLFQSVTVRNSNDGIYAHATSGTATIEQSSVNSENGAGIRGFGTTFELDDVESHSDSGRALVLNDSDATATSLDIGGSTEPGTTLDFNATNVQIERTENPPAATDGFTDVGRFFNAEEYQAPGASTLDVQVYYEPSDAYGVAADTFELRRYNDSGSWTTAGSDHDDSNNLVSASDVTSFGDFGLFARPVANYSVSLPDENLSAREGENLTVTANVTNLGEADGEQHLVLSQDGTELDNRSVPVNAGTSANVDLIWTTKEDDAGEYDLNVTSENDSDAVSTTIEEGHDFAIEGVEAPTVVEGEVANVTATVNNTGLVAGDGTVDLFVDGSEPIDSRSISLDPASSRSVDLQWNTSTEEPGNYSVEIASDDDNGTANLWVQERAHVNVSDLHVNSSIVRGETLEVSATFENEGEAQANQTVRLLLNGNVSAERKIALNGTESDTLQFTSIEAPVSGDSVNVTVASDDTSATKVVDILEPAYFDVAIESPNDPVVEGHDLTVTANVTNTGEVTAEKEVNLTVAGTTSSDSINLSAGEHGTVSLNWTAPEGDNGTYDATVRSPDDSDNESVTVHSPPNFQLGNVSTGPSVEQGDVLSVDVPVENTGQATGNVTVAVNVSGVVVEQTVEIGGGNETSVTLDVGTGSLSPGNHLGNVTAGDSRAEFDVTIEEPSDTGGLPPSGGGDPGPDVSVSIEDTNSPVGVGDTVRVTATVTSTGGTSAAETVTLTAGGTERDSQQIGANASETVDLEWNTGSGDAGRHLVEVAAGSSTNSTYVTVNEDSPAIEVTVGETTEPVVEREPLDVTATLEAHETASQTVRLVTPGGETVDSRDVDLSAGDSETVTLVWQTERGDAGSGFLRVESGDNVATADVTVEETPAFAVDVTGTSSPVDAEETLTVDARVSSEAEEERRGYVTLAVDGETRDGQVVTLGGSEDAETVELTLETGADDAGEYDATVDVGSDSATAGVSVEDGSGPLFPYAPEWTGSAVDYELTSQDTHVGVFFWLTLLVGGLGAYVLATRATLDARLLGVTLLVAGVRTGTDVLHATVGGAALEPLLALNTALELYVGLLFLAFAAAYVDDDVLLERRSVATLAGVAAVGTLAIATNSVHGLVFSDAELAEAAFTYVTAQTGPLGWAILSVTLVSLLFSVGLLVQSFLAGTEPEWRPVGVLASGLCLALLVVVLSVLERGPLPHYDYTGAGVAGFLALTTTTLFGHGLQRIKHHAQRSLIEDLEDPIVVTNDRRVVVEYNDAAADLLPGIAAGVRFDRLVAYAPDWPSSGASTTAEQSRSGLLPTRSAASSDTGAIQPAMSDHSDQEASEQAEVHYLVQTTSVTADTGDSIGYTVRFTDVSELKRRTNALARKNAQLEQVASTISHDLRNPLSVADGYVDIMQDNVPGPGQRVRASDVEDHLGPIQRAVDRMEAIIDDILALARSAESVSTTEAVEYDELVEEAWRTVDTDEATLFIESTGLVDADGQRLRRILENLFRNAVEHAGDDVAVVTGITDDGFYVADDGPGIPASERDDVFEEGYSSAADGTGLGLAIVRQLASAHDWEVHLDPEYDGARFVFTGATTMAHREGPASGALQHD